MIDLYTAATPNGWKASCILEELELEYELHALNLAEGDQKKPDFLKINPNGRIPAIYDRDLKCRVFESAAIMIHLCEKTGSPLLPTGSAQRAEVLSWLMFQMGGIGPMMGQANVFYRYWPEKIQSVIERYQNESRRLFEVLDRQLEKTEWLAGDFSIADIANWCWVRTYKWSGVRLDDLEHLSRWNDAIHARPGCYRGIHIPESVRALDESDKDDETTEKFVQSARKMVQT